MVILLHLCQENDTRKENKVNVNYFGNISVNNTELAIHLVVFSLFLHYQLSEKDFIVTIVKGAESTKMHRLYALMSDRMERLKGNYLFIVGRRPTKKTRKRNAKTTKVRRPPGRSATSSGAGGGRRRPEGGGQGPPSGGGARPLRL